MSRAPGASAPGPTRRPGRGEGVRGFGLAPPPEAGTRPLADRVEGTTPTFSPAADRWAVRGPAASTFGGEAARKEEYDTPTLEYVARRSAEGMIKKNIT